MPKIIRPPADQGTAGEGGADIRNPPLKKPDWIRFRLPSGETWKQVDRVLEARRLRTVCDEARCPNKGECWGAGTATFMILGDVCTRSCRFCAVSSAREGQPLRADEGVAIARAAKDLGLRYVVLTSVDRDDLPDHGAGHFAASIRAIKGEIPGIGVEALIPDYTGDELQGILAAGPEVIAHNVETVPSLQWVRDRRASFERSLTTLRQLKAPAGKGGPLTKTSLLLGLGEKPEEVLATMEKLRDAGVDILVMGQYLRPSRGQIPVAEYITPEQFARYAEAGQNRGFLRVISSPFARTSYHAREAWETEVSQETQGRQGAY
ncbi:MAG: lipoyl synthase [Treponema sp.]|jgi:lipoic acid synthetase|nr:lipoyl synthase [Treponema sp.]